MINYSVVVPVYNTHEELKTIVHWFERVISNRVEKDVELIVIDDGSSKKLNESFTEGVRYFHKENGGVSSARNLGVKKATGKYVLFLDSDDSYCDNIFNVLDKTTGANANHDIITFSYNKNFGDRNKIIKNKPRVYTQTEFINDYLTKKIKLHICACVFNREFMLCNKLMFNESISHSEDVLFTVDTLFSAKNIIIIDEVLYTYNFREGSAINSLLDKKSLSHFTAINLINNKKTADNEYQVNYFVTTCYMNLILSLIKNKTKDKHIVHEFAKNKKLISGNVFFDFSLSSVLVSLFRHIRFINETIWLSLLKRLALK